MGDLEKQPRFMAMDQAGGVLCETNTDTGIIEEMQEFEGPFDLYEDKGTYEMEKPKAPWLMKRVVKGY